MEDNLGSAAELPYFEGDFWPNVLEESIKELDQEEEEKRRQAEAAEAAAAAAAATSVSYINFKLFFGSFCYYYSPTGTNKRVALTGGSGGNCGW